MSSLFSFSFLENKSSAISFFLVILAYYIFCSTKKYIEDTVSYNEEELERHKFYDKTIYEIGEIFFITISFAGAIKVIDDVIYTIVGIVVIASVFIKNYIIYTIRKGMYKTKLTYRIVTKILVIGVLITLFYIIKVL